MDSTTQASPRVWQIIYNRFIFRFCFIYTVFSTTSSLNTYSCTLSKTTLISPDRNRFSDF